MYPNRKRNPGPKTFMHSTPDMLDDAWPGDMWVARTGETWVKRANGKWELAKVPDFLLMA